MIKTIEQNYLRWEMVPPMHVHALAGALEWLFREPILPRKLRQEARQWAQTFSWERCARESYVP